MESILEYIPLPITTRKPLVEMAMSSPGHLVQIVPIVPMMVSPSLFGIAFARAYNPMPDLDQAYITVWHGSLSLRHASDYHARGVDVMIVYISPVEPIHYTSDCILTFLLHPMMGAARSPYSMKIYTTTIYSMSKSAVLRRPYTVVSIFSLEDYLGSNVKGFREEATSGMSG